ncbi:hypothetical protein ACTNBL_04460 [Enterococcus villorum]|jgi:hypothetical protein|uniref:Uncharacterized protein n=2 Tax=Enterococcus villorum TaxID=112904 RepID=A0A511J0U8_9ENTE|nr:hypothetical protein [Enterococcus villorum]EOH89497.1 hypothetical protein UAO_01435 [Enterococcus villorum ATCC 700913]EOW75976.1 hypothetical protein I591_01276 [Enterococcus villorum ATCC 700913]GEL91640.1 hypothetical protein EVI01_09770 [Enterococcus villorum]
MVNTENYLILLNQLVSYEETDSVNVGVEVIGKITRAQTTNQSLLPKLNTYTAITPVLLGILMILFILMKKKKKEGRK